MLRMQRVHDHLLLEEEFVENLSRTIQLYSQVEHFWQIWCLWLFSFFVFRLLIVIQST